VLPFQGGAELGALRKSWVRVRHDHGACGVK